VIAGGPLRVVTWSGFATAALLASGLVYFAIFAFTGGLQSVLSTGAPPEWALTEIVVLSGIFVLYLLAAVVLTVSLAVVQFHIGPWWAVVGGLCALAAGTGLLVVGSQASRATYATIDTFAFLGFVGYMVATNVVGVRGRMFSAVTAGVGLASTLLLLAGTLAASLVGVGFLVLALILYGAWAVWLGMSSRRGLRGSGVPILQAGPHP
jgi:hypothetical protein